MKFGEFMAAIRKGELPHVFLLGGEEPYYIDKAKEALLGKLFPGGTGMADALQKVSGDDAWMRVNGTSGGTLANDSYNSSFDNAKERSWQVRHDYNFAGLGIPGLTLMNRYVSGSNIDVYTNGVKTRENAEEWGRESELAYTIQEGTLKNLAFRWRNAMVRSNASIGDLDENRLIVSYTLPLL